MRVIEGKGDVELYYLRMGNVDREGRVHNFKSQHS